MQSCYKCQQKIVTAYIRDKMIAVDLQQLWIINTLPKLVFLIINAHTEILKNEDQKQK